VQQSFDLQLDNEASLRVRTAAVERLQNGRVLWHGTVEGGAARSAQSLIVVNGSRMTGTVLSPDGRVFRIFPGPDGGNITTQLDYASLPPEDSGDAPSGPAQPASPAGDTTFGGPTVIDILVAYTSSAQSASGDIDSLIDLAIAEMNQGLANSGINVQARLVGKIGVNYNESTRTYPQMDADLVAGGAAGEMDKVHTERDATGADVVVMLVNNSAFCGRAASIGGGADQAFVAVHYACATGNYSFAHEIGHLVGTRHDLAQDSTSGYAHGFTNQSATAGFRTIMSYACPATNPCDPRINYWSSPSLSYGGVTIGSATQQDNARVWRERASTVSNFRSSWIVLEPQRPLYQLHASGKIWKFTGVVCNGNSCPGWQMLDNNPATIQIVATGDTLFQRHKSGQIWRYTGVPCSGESCPGWQRLDNNPDAANIVAAGGSLYQLHKSGRIWRYTGTPCNGNSCPGWRMLDNNPATVEIAAGGGALYQRHNDGSIFRYTGVPCNGESCPGWEKLDNNRFTAQIVSDGDSLYQRHTTGRVWRYTGQPCSGDSCPGWQMLDNNPATRWIVGGGRALYQLHTTGRIWRYTNRGCSGDVCPGWEMLDNNPATVQIATDGVQLFQRHANGLIWRYTGTACHGESCPGWEMIDNNPATIGIVSADQ
jgi:peptidyl-Asp metalloendopeptidase